MKKVMGAAFAAVVLVNCCGNLLADEDLNTFFKQMEKELKRPEVSTIKSVSNLNLNDSNGTMMKFADGDLCAVVKPGIKKTDVDIKWYYELKKVGMTLASPENNRTRLFITQFQSFPVSKDKVEKLIADIMEKKVKKGFRGKLKKSTMAAEKFIQKQIDSEQIPDHYHFSTGWNRSKDYGTKDFFITTYKWMNAFDFNAKNDKELNNEIIRRNVAIRVFLANVYFNYKSNPDSAVLSTLNSFENGLLLDHCELDIENFGMEDMTSVFFLTKLLERVDRKTNYGQSDGILVEELLNLLYESKFDNLQNIMLQHRELKWNTDKMSEKEEMFTSIIDDLKKRKVMK